MGQIGIYRRCDSRSSCCSNLMECILCVGTPEAQGKADYVSSIVADINHRKGFTAGLSQVLARAFGALSKRRAALHQVRAPVPTAFTECYSTDQQNH